MQMITGSFIIGSSFKLPLKILVILHKTTHIGAASPGLWNSLPSRLKDADLSYSEFRRSLFIKTFLFGQWSHGALWTRF